MKHSTESLNDPNRCVIIGDRESDIYELFCLASELRAHFLVRTCVDRLAGDGEYTVRDLMKHAPVQGLHRVEVRNERGEYSMAVLDFRYCRTVVRLPIGKRTNYPELVLIVIHARRETFQTDATGSTGRC